MRWTCDRFHIASDAGAFEGQNVLLHDGEILEMPAPNPPHNSGLELTSTALREALGAGYWVRTQMALVLSLDHDPVPDIAVIVGSPRTVKVQPTTALLVVEIADSTLAFDLTTKATLYATAKILDYWVLDLKGRTLIVHREPGTSKDGEPVFHSVMKIQSTGTVVPLMMPEATINITEMLP
jgi:Uma2 family endonuclease